MIVLTNQTVPEGKEIEPEFFAMAAEGAAPGNWLGGWVLEDVLLRIALGLVGGIVARKHLGQKRAIGDAVRGEHNGGRQIPADPARRQGARRLSHDDHSGRHL